MARVLIVDDEKNVLKTLSIGLKRWKHTVLQARGGQEALDIIRRQECDVVVSDIRMAPMSGYALAEKLAEQYPDVKIIFMTAYDFDEENERHYLKLASCCLTKPFEVTRLVDAIRKAEDRKGWMVLVIADASEGVKIRDISQSAGYCTDILDAEKDVREKLSNNDYGLFVIDSDFLNDQKWRLLNDIERFCPNRPVILLSQKYGIREVVAPSDLGITYFDRKTFFEDPDTAIHMLRQCQDHSRNA